MAPFLPSLRGYQPAWLRFDVLAGLSVWAVLVPESLVGEWSHECTGVQWLDGATDVTPGARFRGRNRAGMVRWGRVCEIVDVKDRKLAWRTVPTLLYPDSVEWRIRIDTTDEGTGIEQTFHSITIPAILDRLYAIIIPGHRDRGDALAEDLRRLARVAAQTTVTHTV